VPEGIAASYSTSYRVVLNMRRSDTPHTSYAATHLADAWPLVQCLARLALVNITGVHKNQIFYIANVADCQLNMRMSIQRPRLAYPYCGCSSGLLDPHASICDGPKAAGNTSAIHTALSYTFLQFLCLLTLHLHLT
jgi:hypothetical protein